MTYPEHMKHDWLPESCNELMRQRAQTVRDLAVASLRLCEANSEYQAIILRLIELSRRIDEIA